MTFGFGFGPTGGGGQSITNKSIDVAATATGVLYTPARLLGPSSTFQKNSGDANLSASTSNGAIAAAAALGAGVSQAIVIQENHPDGRGVIFKVTLVGAPVKPDAPSVTLTPGNGQITVAWVDGSNGGSPITAHKVYDNGVLIASPTDVGPYVITGLPNGVPHGPIQVSAVNAIDEGPLSAGKTATPTNAATTLPSTLTKVFDFNPSSFAPQADNTALASFVEPVSGATITTTGSPKYRALGGGQAGIDFDGTNAYINIGRPAALTAAVDSGNVTVIAIVENVVAAGGGYNAIITSSTSGTNQWHHMMDGTRAGRYYTGSGNAMDAWAAPWSGTSTIMYGHTLSAGSYLGITSLASFERTYMDASCVYQNALSPLPTSGSLSFGIGGTSSGSLKFCGRIRRILVFAGTATPSDMFQIRKWATEQGYFASNPWDNMPAGYKFTIFDGSSLIPSWKVSALANSLAYRYKTAMGLSYGQYAMIGMGGVPMSVISAKMDAEIDGILSFTGKPARLVDQEWYNSRRQADIIAQQTALIGKYKVKGLKVVIATSQDYANSASDATVAVPRATYNSYDWVGAGADAVAPVHTNVNIGVTGAAPATGGNAYFYPDGLHDTDVGYGVLEGIIRPVINTL